MLIEPIVRLRIALICVATLLGTFDAPCVSQTRSPICKDDLSSVSPADYDRATGVAILDWRETICLEHEDRVRRLERLAAIFNAQDRPTFSEFLLDRRRLPPIFRQDVPLLRIVFPEHSFFDTGKSLIRPEAANALALIAASLRKEVPDVAVFVAGHTDIRGGETYNYNLSIDRANAVATQLNALGIGGVSLWRVGFGAAVPLMPNDSPDHMAINRRVEFVIGARTEAVATWLSDQRPGFCSSRDSAADCKRSIPTAQRHFEAVALTARSGLAIESPAPRPQAKVGGPSRQKTTIAPPAQNRLVIDLDARKYTIPAPM